MQQSAQPLPVNNRWLEIWIKPRAVVRDILDTNPNLYVIPIALLGGILLGFNYGLLGVLFGLITAVPGLYLSAFFVRWVGSWFGGTGSGEDIRAAFAWGGWVPNLQVDILFFILTLISSTLLGDSSAGQFSATVLTSLYVAFRIWAWVVSLQAIAEAHEFSGPHALLTQITMIAIFAVPVFLLFVLI